MELNATAKLLVATAPPAILKWAGDLVGEAVLVASSLAQNDWLTSAVTYQFSGLVWESQGELLTPTRADGKPTEDCLDARGLVRVGTVVRQGDRLIGRTRSRQQNPEEKFCSFRD